MPYPRLSEAALAQQFEGKQVTVKLDMPAAKDGVNIYPNSAEPLKWGEYAGRLEEHGRGVRTGETAVTTKVKVKEKHIEVQLGGGGYGTLRDSLKTVVVAPPVLKTEREKNVDRDLKNTSDPEVRKELEAKRDRLRDDRRREERLLGSLARAEQIGRQSRAQQTALDTGARLNIRFQRKITPADLNPDAIKQALARFVEFQP